MTSGWVVVTGACSGIGRATALLLAQKGCPVVLASDDRLRLQATQHEIEALGGECQAVVVNLLDKESVGSFFERVAWQGRPCSVLVNNAGIGLHKTLVESSDEEVHRVFAINFFAVVTLSRLAVVMMRRQSGGQIVNVSSACGRRSLKNMTAYGASKAAVHAFCQALRAEVDTDGIAVTEILPISVATPFFQTAGYRPKGLVQTPHHIAQLIEHAIRTRPAELSSSRLASWGFVIDALAPNIVEKVMSWYRHRQSS